MKAVWIALVLLIFNVGMSVVTTSGLFTASAYYEDAVIDQYSEYGNFSNLTKTETEAQSMDMFSMAISTLSFNWAYQYIIPLGLENELGGFIGGLNVILLFLNAVAFVEVFMRRSDALQ